MPMYVDEGETFCLSCGEPVVEVGASYCEDCGGWGGDGVE